MISIIIPLEFHRDVAERCIRGWTSQSQVPADACELLLAAPDGFDPEELQRLKRHLRGHDRIMLYPEEHDMALVARAAREARGDVLFFTESHCWPEADVLAQVEATLAEHPEWSGFSCRSVPVTHNRISEVEAEMYDADIEQAMLHHPWRKILDQCFVVRRAHYELSGGFMPEFGHFAEWLLAARFDRLGLKLGYAPHIRVHHYYIGLLKVWREFTEDFVDGEMRFMFQDPPDTCADMLLRSPALSQNLSFSRPVAWRLLRLVMADLRLHASAREGRECFKGAWRWLSVMLFRSAFAQARASLRVFAAGVRARWAAARWSRARLREALDAYCNALVERRRLSWMCRSRGMGPVIAASGNREQQWHPSATSALPTAGFYLQEELDGVSCAWSEPVAAMRLPLGVGKWRIRIEWIAVRPPGDPAELRLFFNELPVTSSRVKMAKGHCTAVVKVRKLGESWLGWTCRAHHAPGDRRPLGILVRRVSWAPMPAHLDKATGQLTIEACSAPLANLR